MNEGRVQVHELRFELMDPCPGFADGTLAMEAWRGDERVAWIVFCDFGDRLWIRWIEVSSPHQGRGIANLLLDEARRRFHLDIATGGFADDHARAWYTNYIERHWELPEPPAPTLSDLDASAALPSAPSSPKPEIEHG